MKCPKCGYISFDYNEACPKCRKDISVERNSLNVMFFEPAVPFLLGALTGEAGEADMDINIAAPGVQSIPHVDEEIDIDEEISPALDDEEDISSLDDDLDIGMDEDWSAVDVEEESVAVGALPEIETGEPVEGVLEADDSLDDLGLDLEDIEESIAAEEGPMLEPVDEAALSDDDDFSFDFDELTTESVPTDKGLDDEESVIGGDDDLSLDLDELSLDDDELSGDITTGDSSPTEEESLPGMEPDSIDLEEEDDFTEEPVIPGEDEEVLTLDDLKINETGELEIDSPQMKEAMEWAGDSHLDETIDVDDLALREDDATMENVDVREDSAEAYDLTVDLGDLSLHEEPSQPLESDDDEFMIDMDDLELDLDLDLGDEEPDKSS